MQYQSNAVCKKISARLASNNIEAYNIEAFISTISIECCVQKNLQGWPVIILKRAAAVAAASQSQWDATL